jgi:hypothetical protein
MAAMMPVINGVRLEGRSKGIKDLRCWHVSYQFCGVSAETTVYAHNKAGARVMALKQLRRRGLKVARGLT